MHSEDADRVATITIQDVEIPKLGYGTWQVKGEACREGVRHALKLGYRHIDTAQIYENEAEVGEGIAESGVDRDSIFLTTKIWNDEHAADDVRQSTEASLERLGTDHVDLLLIHWPIEEDAPLEETLEAMVELQEQGKAHLIGVSNFTPSQFERACELAPIACNQVEYHPFLDQSELVELAREHDALLTAYSPLAQGHVLEDPTLQNIAEKYDKSPTQIALRWLLQQRCVSAIPRSTSAEHRASNFDVLDFELAGGDMAQINKLARGQRLVDPDWAPDWGS